MKCNLCKNSGNCYQEICYNQMQTVCNDFEQGVVGKPVYYIQKYFNDLTLGTYSRVKASTFGYVDRAMVEEHGGTLLNYGDFFLTLEEAQEELNNRGGD